jgi:uncharacterized protein with HEPN domain
VKRSVRLRLTDMLDAITGIEATVAEVRFEDYTQSWTMRRAVERGIEIISEASRHLPDELKGSYPQIYWREIAAIGNLLRHEYGKVDDRIIWRVVEHYLPELRGVVVDLLRKESRPPPKRTR